MLAAVQETFSMATNDPMFPKPGADQPRHDPAPTPDEDGPHDVPDDAVIEKTLPSRPLRGEDTSAG
jgi:hypothetical protein